MNPPVLDRDLGWKEIQREMLKLDSKVVKVGITKESGKDIPNGKRKDGKTTIVQYAYWNEMGVHGSSKWMIPPRPFVKGWALAKESEITETMQEVSNKVSGGHLKAMTAFKVLGLYGKSGIMEYIRNSDNFVPNAPLTRKRKKSSAPLIDEGFLIGAVNYEIADKNEDEDKEE